MDENIGLTQQPDALPDIFPAGMEDRADAGQPSAQVQEAQDAADADTAPDLPEGNASASAAPLSGTAEAAAAVTQQAEQPSDASIRSDLANFAAAFPEVYSRAKDDPKVIPQSVWDAVNSGRLSLTAAYARYALAQANAEAQRRDNAARSTGSMRSAGNDAKNSDPFLSGLEG